MRRIPESRFATHDVPVSGSVAGRTFTASSIESAAAPSPNTTCALSAGDVGLPAYSHISTRVAAIGTSTRSIRGTAPLAGASGSRGGQRDTTLDARTEVGIGAVVNVSTTSGAG